MIQISGEVSYNMEGFETPILEFNTGGYAQSLHDSIIKYVYEQESKHEDKKNYSLIGKTSFHTDPDLCDLGLPWCEDLRSLIMNISKGYYNDITGNEMVNFRIDCWAILLRKGDISALHTHPGSDISGAYYIKVPKNLNFEQREGNLVLIDPRPAARQSLLFAGKSIHIKAEEGKGVLFPSWLEHEVYAHHKDEDRISISWNITLL